MQNKTAKADVTPKRQRTQYSCMATSLSMCLESLGVETTEDEVNRVLEARPLQGAAWEEAIAAAQYYGCKATLVCPCSVQQLKAWTDQGFPVMIAWNPEGRDWSHASVVYDVDENLNVHVADPNIPDPDETTRILPKGEFYKRWFEKWSRYLVRRPAMMIEREVSSQGFSTHGTPKVASNAEKVSTMMVEIPKDIARRVADKMKSIPTPPAIRKMIGAGMSGRPLSLSEFDNALLALRMVAIKMRDRTMRDLMAEIDLLVDRYTPDRIAMAQRVTGRWLTAKYREE